MVTIPRHEKNPGGVGSDTRPLLAMLLQCIWKRPWGLDFQLEPRSLLLGWGWGTGGAEHRGVCETCDFGRPARTLRPSDMRGERCAQPAVVWASDTRTSGIPRPHPRLPESGTPGLGQHLCVRPSEAGVLVLLTFENHHGTCSHCQGDGDTASDATRRFSQESHCFCALESVFKLLRASPSTHNSTQTPRTQVVKCSNLTRSVG